MRRSVKWGVAIALVILVCITVVILPKTVKRSFDKDEKVTIDGDVYLYRHTGGKPLFFESALKGAKLGTSYGQIIARFGDTNGELNYNGMWRDVFYRTGKNRYIVLHFDYKGVNSYNLPLIGISIYNETGFVKVVKERNPGDADLDRTV